MALIDPAILKDKLAAVGTELIQNGNIPPDVAAKIPIWTGGMAVNAANALAAKATGDSVMAAVALREIALYEAAFKAEVIAADLRGLSAGEIAVRRIAGIALDITMRVLMAAVAA